MLTQGLILRMLQAGIELQGGAIVNKWVQAAANVSFSRNRLKNFSEFIDDYDAGGQKINSYKQSDIAYSPNIIGAATITLSPIKCFEMSLQSKYVGEQIFR